MINSFNFVAAKKKNKWCCKFIFIVLTNLLLNYNLSTSLDQTKHTPSGKIPESVLNTLGTGMLSTLTGGGGVCVVSSCDEGLFS